MDRKINVEIGLSYREFSGDYEYVRIICVSGVVLELSIKKVWKIGIYKTFFGTNFFFCRYLFEIKNLNGADGDFLAD